MSSPFLNRLGDFVYWIFIFLSALFIFFSVKMLFEGTENSWLGLFLGAAIYFLGFGFRYLLSGKTNHPIALYYKKMRKE